MPAVWHAASTCASICGLGKCSLLIVKGGWCTAIISANGAASDCLRCAAAACNCASRNAVCCVPTTPPLITPTDSPVFEYKPMIFTKGALSVKYTPPCVMVVRAKPLAAGSLDGVFEQKFS